LSSLAPKGGGVALVARSRGPEDFVSLSGVGRA
jgi:hypothetical protein